MHELPVYYDGSPDETSFEIASADPEEPESTVKDESTGALEEGQKKPTIGGLPMKIKLPAPEEMLRRFAKLLEALTGRDYVPLIEIHDPVHAAGCTSDPERDGMVEIVV